MRLSVRRFCILIFMIHIIRNWKNIPKLFIFVEYDFSRSIQSLNKYKLLWNSNNEREMDYIVVLDNEDEPNIETFREQCIFSVTRYDPDTKKQQRKKTESMPIEVQIPSSITYYIRFAKILWQRRSTE